MAGVRVKLESIALRKELVCVSVTGMFEVKAD